MREDLIGARCAGNPGPFDGADPAAALVVCSTCPVTAACLAFGRQIGGWGVWGGTVLDGRRPAGEPPDRFAPAARPGQFTIRPELARRGRCIVCAQPAPPRNRYCSHRCTVRAASIRKRQSA